MNKVNLYPGNYPDEIHPRSEVDTEKCQMFQTFGPVARARADSKPSSLALPHTERVASFIVAFAA